jgi:hypothetical protein
VSYHIPSEREEARALKECDHVQQQLDRRDNPFGLEVDPAGPTVPYPLVEGQVLTWDLLSHKHGRHIERVVLVAIRWRGELKWCQL